MKVIRLVDEADIRSIIEGKEYEDTLILGPAVIAPLERVEFSDIMFGAEDLDQMFLEIPEKRRVLGVIGLVGVAFRRCRFDNVCIIGTREVLERFQKELEDSTQELSEEAAE